MRKQTPHFNPTCKKLSPDQNPNVVTPDGKVLKKLSPFGPVELWREIGAKWAASPLMKQLQQWYPNPPLVVLLSNNEAGKLRWQDVETDARFVQKYGKDRDDNFKRKVLSEGWIERYRAMQEGMCDALVAADWPLQDRQNVKITLPDYGKITVNAPVTGAFYEVEEKTREIQKVP